MYERPSLCREQRIAGTGRSTLAARPDLSAAIPTCCQQDTASYRDATHVNRCVILGKA